MRKRGRFLALFGVAILSLAALLAGGSCADGDNQSPAAILDLHYFFRADALVFAGRVSEGSTAGVPDTRILAWTSPGDDGFDGEASLYDVRYFLASDLARLGLTDGAQALRLYWDQARNLVGEPKPRRSKRLAQLFLPRINPGETVWFAMRTMDEVGQESDTSNVFGPLHIRRLMIAVREAPGDTAAGFGGSVAAAGDVNGDAFPDMLIGSTAQGAAALVLGASNTTLIRRQLNINGVYALAAVPELTPRIVIHGDTAAGFGAAVAGLYNLSGDAKNDIGAGAPGYNPGSTADQGAVYIYYGRAVMPAELSADSVDVVLTGDAAGDRFGAALAPAFELNGDGRGEFAVGAPGAFASGAAYVFKGLGLASGPASGPASSLAALIKGEAAGDSFGAVVASAGDVNGDGYQDVAVGAPDHNGGAGAVYIFYGGVNGIIAWNSLAAGGTVLDLSAAKADVTIRGSVAGRRFGKAIAAGGNLAGDADAARDLAVSGGDTVYVFFGPYPLLGLSVDVADTSAGAQLSGVAGEEFGAAVLGAGDMYLDGHEDLVVGAPGAGACYIFEAPITSGKAPYEKIAGAGSRFGSGLAGPGDVNADRYLDLLIAAPGAGEAYFAF